MFIKYFFLGFFVKVISSFDDTLTSVPLVATITKTRKGRLAFSLGWFFSLLAVIGLVLVFSEFLSLFPYTKYLVSSLIFLLAFVVYFDLFSFDKKKKLKKKEKKIKEENISVKRFWKLVGFGFAVAFITSIDDAIVFIPLFIKGLEIKIYSFLGILLATLANIIFIFYFSGQAGKIKHKKEISVIGLVLLGILILSGVL